MSHWRGEKELHRAPTYMPPNMHTISRTRPMPEGGANMTPLMSPLIPPRIFITRKLDGGEELRTESKCVDVGFSHLNQHL